MYQKLSLKKKLLAFFLEYSSIHVKWDPCHNDLVRPRYIDAGDGLQICRIDVNVLNK
jgi:hypothetical protein